MFPKGYDVTKPCMSKEPFKIQDRSMDFHFTEYGKYTTLQPTFKKLLFITFWCTIKEKHLQ